MTCITSDAKYITWINHRCRRLRTMRRWISDELFRLHIEVKKLDTNGVANFIIGLVTDYFDVDVDLVTSKATKKRHIIDAKHIAMKLIHDNTTMSSQQIAILFRCDNHGTVLHAYKMVQRLCETDKFYECHVRNLQSEITKILNNGKTNQETQ